MTDKTDKQPDDEHDEAFKRARARLADVVSRPNFKASVNEQREAIKNKKTKRRTA